MTVYSLRRAAILHFGKVISLHAVFDQSPNMFLSQVELVSELKKIAPKIAVFQAKLYEKSNR